MDYDVWDFHCRLCGSRFIPATPPCVICGGNVARAERLKRELGVRTNYFGRAPDAEWQDKWLGISLMLAMYMRFRPGKPPKKLLDWVTTESCYSLDAPETMPAGACQSLAVPEAADDSDQDPHIPVQITVSREAACS